MLIRMLLSIVSLLGVSSTYGAIVYYDIPQSASGPNPGPTALSVLASSITKGAGQFTVSTSSGTAFLESSSSASTLNLAITGQDYLEFSVAVSGLDVMSLTNLVLNHKSEGGAVSNLAVFASLTGFSTAPLASAAVGIGTSSSNTYANSTFSLAASQFQNLTNSTVTFRIYGYDDLDLAASYSRIDNITLNGVVPEPSSALLSLFALPFLLRRKRC